MPRDTNAHGTIFGGYILSLIDQAGAIAGHRIGARTVVTVAMNKVVFRNPVRVGDIVSCYAEILKVGNTSVTVRVWVETVRPGNLSAHHSVTVADVVYVNVDNENRPLPIPQPR